MGKKFNPLKNSELLSAFPMVALLSLCEAEYLRPSDVRAFARQKIAI